MPFPERIIVCGEDISGGSSRVFLLRGTQLKVLLCVYIYDNLFKDETLKISGGPTVLPVVRDRNIIFLSEGNYSGPMKLLDSRIPFIVTTYWQKQHILVADVNINLGKEYLRKSDRGKLTL